MVIPLLYLSARWIGCACLQPVEILIAVSILVSAIHDIRPMAAGFGFIHGFAFASVLSDMNLGAATLAVSILGFNIGIELMQLFIITITIPWLLLFGQTSLYKYVRITGDCLAGTAAVGWIVERSTGTANLISTSVARFYPYAAWLAVVSGLAYVVTIYLFKKRLYSQHLFS